MSMELAGTKSGISERFVPDQDRGRLIEVEHLARYRWAAQLAAGRTVLDAGCGTAYGTRLLAEAGAREVVGIDIAEPVLAAVGPTMPESVRLDPGDLRHLGYDDDSFELIVCFEVIEHMDEPLVVLDELVRVLRPNGLLLISSPNRGVYPEGNPHHLHEFVPAELQGELEARLSNVRLMRQHDYLVSAVLSDISYAQGDGETVADVELSKLAAGSPGEELYTLALASDAPLPEPRQLAAMTGTFELSEWMSAADIQTRAIRHKDIRIAELEARTSDHQRLGELLTDAEQRNAAIPELQQRIVALEEDLAQARRAGEDARAETHRLDDRLMRAEQVLREVFGSPSWQVTKPLRYAKRRLRG